MVVRVDGAIALKGVLELDMEIGELALYEELDKLTAEAIGPNLSPGNGVRVIQIAIVARPRR
jgi:hypothetical protein